MLIEVVGRIVRRALFVVAMNAGDLDAARVVGGAFRLVRGPTGGPVRQQGQELGSIDDLWNERSRLFLAARTSDAPMRAVDKAIITATIFIPVSGRAPVLD